MHLDTYDLRPIPGMFTLAADGKTLVKTEDFWEWKRWMEEHAKTLCVTAFTDCPDGLSIISTVFNGVAQPEFGHVGLWQTSVLGGWCSGHTDYYNDYESALEGHRRAVDKVMGIQKYF